MKHKINKIIAGIISIASIMLIGSCKDIANTLNDIDFEKAYEDHIEPVIEKITDIDYQGIYNDYLKDKLPTIDDLNIDKLGENLNLYEKSGTDKNSSETYMILNDNLPNFETYELTTNEFEKYSELDSLGRCGTAYANISLYTMPTDDRDSIGMIKPSGWPASNPKYDHVDGKYLYNRCHLIGFQLAGENANKLNLVTGTRYMNVDGMLPFENEVADYVHKTRNHVLYRVTPLFIDDELVCRGVQIEACSVEDNGQGVCFNVFVYNIQPGVKINYKNGDSELIS